MALILNIDTSSDTASICVAKDGVSVAFIGNAEQRDHAAWIHPAIEQLLQQVSCTLNDLKAVAVTEGPGSYTGLRVSMSSAKGLCYTLKIPFITENTLRVMALSMQQGIPVEEKDEENVLLCPMLDARRMEVFTALFNSTLDEVVQSTALILDSQTFSEYLSNHNILFSGSGTNKFRQLLNHPNAKFLEAPYSAAHLAVLSYKKFLLKEFNDIAYAEPRYLKEFYTRPKNNQK